MKKSAIYEENRKALVASILLIVIIFSASYAYFTSYNNAKAGYNAGIAEGLNITYLLTAGSELTLSVNPSDLNEGNVGEYVESNKGVDSVTLDNASEYPNVVCSYKILYTPTVPFTNSSQNTSGAEEFVLIGTDLSGDNEPFTFDLAGITSETVMYEGSIYTNPIILSKSQSWEFVLRHYNLATNQNDNIGKTFSGKVSFKATGCKPLKTLSDTVLALESSKDYKSSQDNSIYRVVDQNGIRYEGKDPDNYVEYNGELWRIIGTFNGSDMNLDPNKEYTKIVRSTPLETYMAWDTGGENDWVNSTLNAYLNGEYLSSLSTTAQEMIAEHNGKYSLWHLRGTDSTTNQSLYAVGWYDIERNTGTPGYRNGVLGDADAAKEAAIGLMYPSDYGYAAYGSSCNNENTETLYNYKGSCAKVDWLLYSDYWEWLISPCADRSDYAFYVSGNFGGYVGRGSVSVGNTARPVLYLEADVEVKSGNGSRENPYKIQREVYTLSEVVLAKESSSDYTSSQDGTVYRVVDQNGVRYEGKNPDNYVEYNGELWRIIGTFNGSDMNLDPNKEYTKIIKATPISMAWDCSDVNGDGSCYDSGEYENDWVKSTLNAYLNGEYLNSLSTMAKGQIATFNNKYSLWHLRGTSSSNFYASGWYEIERETGTAGYRNGTAGAADAAKEAAIGLMYPSDYGYAAYGTTCNNESTEPLQNYDGACAAVDWLMDGSTYNKWLISPYSGGSGDAFYVDGIRGGFVHNSFAFDSNEVHPTLYLEADVEVASGDGSEDSPYKLQYEAPKEYLSDYVLALENEEDYISSQDGSIYRVVDQNGVRYEGKDPDNYVWYNCTDDNDTSTCERWRIIGVFDGTDVGLNPSKKYTKIARSTPLETNMAWDTGGESDWVNSTLNTYLNGEYLSSLSTTAQVMIAKYNGKYSLWHLRGVEEETSYTLYASGWYEIERSTGTPGYRNGIAGAADAAKEYAIGLMYPSDYGYAAYGNACNNESTETLVNYEGSCAAVDWLLYSDYWEWLISPVADISYFAFYVLGTNGGFVSRVSVDLEYAARPVLYLEASVEKKAGQGTYDLPYELG